MLTVYYKNSNNHIVRHTIDLTVYYCPWRQAWVAYDANLEPDEDGDFPFYGSGETRADAVEDLVREWEDRQ